LSDEEASFAEPLGCCIASVEKCSLDPGGVAAIIGAGTMGLLHLQLFLGMGARVLVVEPDEGRRDFAQMQGADLRVEPAEAKDAILDHTNGRGAQTVVIAAGTGRAVELGFDLVSSGGTLMLFAGIWPATTIQLDPNLIHYKQINVTGSVGALMVDFEKALALMNNGAVDVASLISETFPLDEIMEAHRASERNDTYKVIVKP
jgi:threonine dehydrogenase-like Zn-dependent dehydrogenase